MLHTVGLVMREFKKTGPVCRDVLLVLTPDARTHFSLFKRQTDYVLLKCGSLPFLAGARTLGLQHAGGTQLTS